PDYNLIINKELERTFINTKKTIKKIPLTNISINMRDLRRRMSRLKGVLFEVTQRCNMSCKYCIFGGNYYYFNKLGSLDMDTLVARNVIESLYEKVKGNQTKVFGIGFFGGEPILNLSGMQKIISLSKCIFKGWELLFNITTNGTLLTDKVIDYFIENDISILISLDGPKCIHDSKRLFKNKKGTYNKIINNLVNIRNRQYEYYLRKVTLVCVWSEDLSINEIYNYFSSNEIVNKLQIRFNPVLRNDNNYYDNYKMQPDRLRIIDAIKNKIINKINKNEPLLPIDRIFLSDYERIEDRLMDRRFYSSLKTCLFDGRLFVDVHGNYHICNQINPLFPIGNYKSGHDIKKMKSIYDQYTSECSNHCYKCEVRFLCDNCYATIAKDGSFVIDEDDCIKKKAVLIRQLERYIEYKMKTTQ
ncbi:MAG: radical SAM protein, partial [Clostridiales bacterium]|nr:radical SAM protein [Clostridiales bacterium]